MARGPRDLSADDRRIWARVTGTVTPPRSRKATRVTPGAIGMAEPDPIPRANPLKPPPKTPPPKIPPKPSKIARAAPLPASATPPPLSGPRAAPGELEPRRQRRLSRERDPIEATIDLHGFGRFEAEDQLVRFLSLCQARGLRAVLVSTGQGRLGSGVIRASIVEWLQGARLRPVVAGWSTAHRRHGGDGAFYNTLRRQ